MMSVIIKITKQMNRKLVLRAIFSIGIMSFFCLSVGCSSTNSSTYCRINANGDCGSQKITEPVLSYDTPAGYPLNGFEGSPIRKGENIQQIWIGPYEDKEGNFHEPSYVYAVVKNGSWIGDPEKEIQE